MKSHLLTLTLALGLLPLATAATVPFPDAPEAREKAKADNKPILLLWHGSDWMFKSSELCTSWKELAKSKLPVLFAQFDEKTGLTDEDRKKANMPTTEHNLPVALLLTPDGTLLARYTGETVRSAKAMEKAVKKDLKDLEAFSAQAQQALAAKGKEGAIAAGKALDMLELETALRHRALTEKIKQGDPNDETGYLSKYCIEHMGMYKIINNLLKGGPEGKKGGKDRDFTAAEKRVRDTISRRNGAQPALGTEQHQQWLAGLYYIQKERMLANGSTDRSEVLATLQQIVKLDPKSEYGKGAATYRRYWDPKSFFEVEDGFYEAKHQVHGFEKEWHVDVTDQVEGPGTYTFRLVPHLNGKLTTRNYRLVVNGKEVDTPDIDPKTSTKEVELELKSAPKGAKVEVWITTQCHDHWFSCSGTVEFTKK